MPPRRQHRPRKAVARGRGLPASLHAVHLNAAGNDIGSAEQWDAGLRFEWTLPEGFERRNRLSLAEYGTARRRRGTWR